MPDAVGWHVHRWSKWSSPERFVSSSFAAEIQGEPTISEKFEYRQVRVCERCGLIKRRKVR